MSELPSAVPAPEERVRRTVLDNGIRVITDAVPGAASVALGAWVMVGARDEDERLAGASHFLEHLLFKGTDTWTARELGLAVDAVGGDMNAYTASDHTTYYLRLPGDAVGFGTDVLLDVLDRPALRPEEVEVERNVILEELAAAEDDPADLVHRDLYAGLYPDHPLGREVAGSEESIEAMGREDIATFFDDWYRPANLVVCGAGLVDHDGLVEKVAARFGDREAGVLPQRTVPEAGVAGRMHADAPVEQVHLALGWRALDSFDPDRYALAVLNHALGGGPASRLFFDIREERGLVYTIFSGASSQRDTGTMSLYCACHPRNAAQVLDLVDAAVDDITTRGITERELAVAKGSLRGGWLIGLEDHGGRMTRLGTAENLRGGVSPMQQHLDALMAVSLDDVHRVAKRVLTGPRVLATAGPKVKF